MSVGTARFYALRCSLSQRVFPLFDSQPQIAPYLKATVENVHYAKGLQTSIDVPDIGMFNLFCNVVEIDGIYYWIVDAWERTAANGQYHYELQYMGPTSAVKYGRTIWGYWKRVPDISACPYLKNIISSGRNDILESMTPTALELGTVFEDTSTGYEDVGYWMQITGFVTSTGGGKSLKCVGFPIGINVASGRPSIFGIIGMILNGTEKYYPTFEEITENITAYTGINADQIIDCSISKRCPFPFEVTTVSGSNRRQLKLIGNLASGVTQTIEPTLTSDNNHVIYTPYNLSAGSYIPDNVQTLTMNLYDNIANFKRAACSIQIRDWNENNVMEIPTDGNTMQVTFREHSDPSGIYLIVSHGNQMITIPEGKFPYAENTWETYKAYQMNGDRNAMENAILMADRNRENSNISAISNALIGGVSTGVMTGAIASNPAGAAAGIAFGAASLASGMMQIRRQSELDQLNAQMEYYLTQRRAIEAPSSNYNVSYGLIYITLNQMRSVRLCRVGPADISNPQNYMLQMNNRFGVPAEGSFQVTIGSGYYQGMLGSSFDGANGIYLDDVVKEFEHGFKFEYIHST